MHPDEVRNEASPERLNRAGEDYLKAVLILQRKSGVVRSLDIAKRLGVSKPSVSVAVKLLREGGFLIMDADKHICLTGLGHEAAEQIYEKHRVLSECLTALGVDFEVAEKDACRMEHIVSSETIERMRTFVNKGKEECKRQQKKILPYALPSGANLLHVRRRCREWKKP